MDTLKKSKSPMWKRSMVQRLALCDISHDLEEISESGDYYGYEGESLGEYYDEYRPLFDELSTGAYDLLEAIGRLQEFDGEAFLGWDDFVVALIGPVRKVLGYDADQMDYFDMMAWEERAAVQEAEKRLQRLTKAQLIAMFRRVMIALVAYWDIKGSYDTLSAVVNELDSRAAVLANGTPSQSMWVE